VVGKPLIGILALQGCIEPHHQHLKSLGFATREIRLPADLDTIDGLILPGGESTTMLKLAQQFGLWEPLAQKSKQIPFWGICAGAILMAKTVQHPEQVSLGIMDITVVRNAYGRQLQSFNGVLEEVADPRLVVGLPATFIRAPEFKDYGAGVKVLAKVGDKAVFLSQGRHMVTAFHPELSQSAWCHQFFCDQLK
jgi:5'-phosphate synthase pdxT subunit